MISSRIVSFIIKLISVAFFSSFCINNTVAVGSSSSNIRRRNNNDDNFEAANGAFALLRCESDSDCSLNGVCDVTTRNGICQCDAPWYGQTCGLLRTLPVNATEQPGGAIYGWHPNVSSWGGSILPGRQPNGGGGGERHLFVAQMRTGGLVGWGSQSECVHAVSSAPGQPFIRRNLVLDNECHGPVALRDPSHDGKWLLFHIGNGNSSRSSSSSSSSSRKKNSDGTTTTSTSDGEVNTGKDIVATHYSNNMTSSSFMHHASSPDGPWLPAPTDPGSCGMPTAAYHPNGTLYVICGNGARLVAADHWSGPWREIHTFQRPDGWEDPTLWFDRRGNWHIIWHVFALQPYEAHHERYSGHAYSKDGTSWVFSHTEPFNGTISFVPGSKCSRSSSRSSSSSRTEGSFGFNPLESKVGHNAYESGTMTFSTRERPQMIFASTTNRTTPIGMTSAVSPQPIGPWCDTRCKQHTCSQCKVTPGLDWTYTIFVPLETRD